jgi:hypothetical protein
MFQAYRERAARATTRNHAKTGTLNQQHAYLGRGDGSGVIIAANAPDPRSVWVYQDTVEGRKFFPAALGSGCGIPYEDNPAFEGTPVILGYPPASTVLTVLSQGGLEGGAASGGPNLIEQKIIHASYTTNSQMVPLRLDAYEVDGSYTTLVHVAPAWYHDATGLDVTYFGGDTYDLAATIAALNAGEHQLALILLDTATGLLDLVTGTAAVGTNKDAFSAGDIDDLAYVTTKLPCGAVHLYYGQTEIVEADIYRGEADPRVFFTPPTPIVLSVDDTNVSNPPTDAELTAAYGAQADGFVKLLDDGGAGTTVYLVFRANSKWWHIAATEAT